MTATPDPVLDIITATWPPEATTRLGPFLMCRSDGGGSRVRAARLAEGARPATRGDIDAAVAWMRGHSQPVRFMVMDGQGALDTDLADAGFAVRDPTLVLAAPVAAVAAAPPPVTVFETWPPLAIQAEIWDQGGIGPDRRAIMARAATPKISLFGRADDRPAGSAFAAIADDIAMVHALEVAQNTRRKGLGAHMMRAAADWAERNGAARIMVLVTEDNTAARALYASLGFDPVGRYHYRGSQDEGPANR